MAKQVTITIESNSLVVMNARDLRRMWCPRCESEREVLRFGPYLSGNHRVGEALWQLIASGDVHRQEAPDGSALICLNSLLDFIHGRLQSRSHGLRGIKTEVEEI
jgi:hypothetical protein